MPKDTVQFAIPKVNYLVYQIFYFRLSGLFLGYASFFPSFRRKLPEDIVQIDRKEVKKVNNIALSKAMDLNPATVLEMVRKLVDRKLVELLPDKSITVDGKGQKKGPADHS